MIKELFQELTPYNTEDLISTAGALQIAPENCDFAIRLEAFAYALCCQIKQAGKPNISTNKLRQLINKHPNLLEIKRQEDPCNNLLTEEIQFFEGGHLVFPGIIENPVFITKNLLKSIFLSNKFSDSDFPKKASEATQAILLLSNAIARKAGYTRYIEPSTPRGGDIFIPSKEKLESLKKAITFSEEEINILFKQHHLSLDILQPFITDLGRNNIEEYDLMNSPLYQTPIMAFSESLVVILPGILLATLCHKIIALAYENNIYQELAVAYHEACWDNVIQSLTFTNNDLIFEFKNNEPPNTMLIKEGVFDLDNDKLIYVQFISDNLENFDKNMVFGSCDNQKLIPKLEEKQIKAEENLIQRFPRINEIVVLIIFQGIGRLSFWGFEESPPPLHSDRLLFAAADLETICLLEGGKKLTFWQYAKAHNQIRKHTKIVVFDPLDEFGFYKKQGCSYYGTDDQKPNVISIFPDFAGALRREVIKKRDFHVVPSYTERHTIQVTNLHDDIRIPISTPIEQLGKRVVLCVEIKDLPVWIVASDEIGVDKKIYAEFADFIAYWLWQFSPFLETYITEFIKLHNIFKINIILQKPEKWGKVSAGDDSNSTRQVGRQCFEIKLDNNFTLNMNLYPEIQTLLSGGDNSGEREIIKEILRSIRAIMEINRIKNISNYTDEKIDFNIDRFAPLGLKKKLFFLTQSDSPFLDDSHLPSQTCKIEAFNQSQIFDEIGEYLAKVQNLVDGEIADDKRTEILNGIVGFLFNKLVKIFSTLSQEGLIEFLLLNHEKIVHQREFNKLILPTRIACFGSLKEIVEKLGDEISEINISASSVRFLIEYIVAVPTTGLRPLSLTIFNEMLVIAAEIIRFGELSDLVKYKIADIKLSISKSGRLISKAYEFNIKTKKHMEEYIDSHIEYSVESFSSHWRNSRDNTGKSEFLIRLDKSFEAEWGYSYSELLDVIHTLYSICLLQNNSYASKELNSLIQELFDKTRVEKRKIQSVLNNLTLRKRGDFLDYNSTNKKPNPDVYPWRHNRDLSFLRRPLLMVEKSNECSLIWGNRHLLYSMNYLLNLCSTGRIKSKSQQMQRFISKLANKHGNVFNDRVFSCFKNRKHILSKKKVNTIFGNSIELNKKELGDIDVMAVHIKKRKIIIIECKDLTAARTPFDLKSELDKLFLGSKSALEKHKKRIAWIVANYNLVLNEFGLEQKGKWSVEGLFVVDSVMLSTHLYPTDIPIVTFKKFSGEWLLNWMGQ